MRGPGDPRHGKRGSLGPRCAVFTARASARSRRRAFTLAESLIASVVLAIGVVAVAATITASHEQTQTLETGSVAISLARQLMEEIAAKPLVASDPTPGWSGGEYDRNLYDTINDYAGYKDTSPVQTREGPKMAVGSEPFTREVKITYPTELFGTTPPAGEFAIVEVKVINTLGQGCTLRRLAAQTNLKR